MVFLAPILLLLTIWALMWWLALRLKTKSLRSVCPRCQEKLYFIADAKRFYHVDYVLWECSGCSRLFVRCSKLIPWKNWLPWERWQCDPKAKSPQDPAGVRHLKWCFGSCDAESKAQVARWYHVPEAEVQQRHRLWYFGPFD